MVGVLMLLTVTFTLRLSVERRHADLDAMVSSRPSFPSLRELQRYSEQPRLAEALDARPRVGLHPRASPDVRDSGRPDPRALAWGGPACC
jgi:hypothetical protein